MRAGMWVARYSPSGRPAERPPVAMTRSSKPDVWFINVNSVIGWGYVAGTLKVVRYWLTSAFRSSRPAATCCMTAVHVNSFVIDAIRTSDVAGSNGAPVASDALPYPLANTSRPPDTTETAAPGTWDWASRDGSAWSKNASYEGGGADAAGAGATRTAAEPIRRARRRRMAPGSRDPAGDTSQPGRRPATT